MDDQEEADWIRELNELMREDMMAEWDPLPTNKPETTKPALAGAVE